MIWLTADLHLGHGNMIRHAGRPFRSAEEMDEALIGAINDRVGPDDDLWVLGDLTMHAPADAVRAYRARIRCRHVHLVHGNHDTRMRPGGADGTLEHDVAYYDGLRSPAGRRMVLCHYPIDEWNGLRRGSYMLHGHVHSRGSGLNEAHRGIGCLRYDVGVDANGYAPVSAKAIDAWFEGVEPMPLRDWGAHDGGEEGR